ncbi:MAG: FAD-dependent oxidoreductase [Gammaproteobacteria bacterium]|nr:FAD-dependent oxidoreductase [Gammaproteobacteria bacterium]
MSHVVIVGAGPAGASLGYLLACRGVEVTLLERRRDFGREFRGEILMPSGIAALEQMGLKSQLAALPSYTQRTIDVYLNGKLLLRESLDTGSPEDIRFMAVSQPALLEMLVAEAGANPSFNLIRGVSVKALIRDGGGVVGVRIRTDNQERDLKADLVVGADGRNSVVRKQAGLSARQISAPMDIVWCKLPCPGDWLGVRAYAGRGHLLIAYHTWDGTLQLGWVILKGTFGDLRNRGIEQWVEEMANHVSPDFSEHLRAHRDAVHKPFLLDAVSDCVDRWSAPGVLVIGDAAHTMSPVGGQGINIALRDAIVAANHLAPVLCQPEPDANLLAAALDAIETERMPEVRQVQALQAQPPKVLLSRAWWGEPVRHLAGVLLSKPAVRQRAAGRISPFLYGVTDVQLTDVRLP